MTDNDIIKAWEKVIATGDAPIGEHWGCSVTTKLAKETFDMLNRLQAQIKKLENIERLATKTIEKQTAEIERLENMVANKFRIEKSKIPNSNTDIVYDYAVALEMLERLGEMLNEKQAEIEQIKSEAINEFAERLKEGEVYMRIEFPNTRTGTESYIVLSDDIDNLVKEMTEVSEK